LNPQNEGKGGVEALGGGLFTRHLKKGKRKKKEEEMSVLEKPVIQQKQGKR